MMCNFKKMELCHNLAAIYAFLLFILTLSWPLAKLSCMDEPCGDDAKGGEQITTFMITAWAVFIFVILPIAKIGDYYQKLWQEEDRR